MQIYLILLVLFLNSCISTEPIYRLIHANDADSFFVTDYFCKHDCKVEELRLIGLDAPEYSQDPWGKRALEYVLSEIQPSTRIFLEDGLKKYDKYDRRLVFLTYQNNADKRLLNLELLKKGYAQLFTFSKHQKYLDYFKAAELKAREVQVNIWDPIDGLKMSPSQYRRKNRHL